MRDRQAGSCSSLVACRRIEAPRTRGGVGGKDLDRAGADPVPGMAAPDRFRGGRDRAHSENHFMAACIGSMSFFRTMRIERMASSLAATG